MGIIINDNILGGCILNYYHPYLHWSCYILTYSGVVKVLANDYGIRCGACYCLAITMSWVHRYCTAVACWVAQFTPSFQGYLQEQWASSPAGGSWSRSSAAPHEWPSQTCCTGHPAPSGPKPKTHSIFGCSVCTTSCVDMRTGCVDLTDWLYLCKSLFKHFVLPSQTLQLWLLHLQPSFGILKEWERRIQTSFSVFINWVTPREF